MDLAEMWEKFKTNKIDCSEDDILNLFFKNKVIPKGEVPSLDFFNFMMFSLSSEADQDFRYLMRKLRNKAKEDKKLAKEERLKKKSEDIEHQ